MNNLVSKAEERVKARAAEIAYNMTEGIKDKEVQQTLYELCFSYIKLGARFMQEELLTQLNEEHESISKEIE